MPFDPLTAALVGGSALSGLFGGASQASAQRAQTQESKRQFNISSAMDPTRRLEGLPLRDRLLHILLSRFGTAPSTYAGAQASYTPGSGGTAGSQAIYEEMLRRMGYKYNPAGGAAAIPMTKHQKLRAQFPGTKEYAESHNG